MTFLRFIRFIRFFRHFFSRMSFAARLAAGLVVAGATIGGVFTAAALDAGGDDTGGALPTHLEAVPGGAPVVAPVGISTERQLGSFAFTVDYHCKDCKGVFTGKITISPVITHAAANKWTIRLGKEEVTVNVLYRTDPGGLSRVGWLIDVDPVAKYPEQSVTYVTLRFKDGSSLDATGGAYSWYFDKTPNDSPVAVEVTWTALDVSKTISYPIDGGKAREVGLR